MSDHGRVTFIFSTYLPTDLYIYLLGKEKAKLSQVIPFFLFSSPSLPSLSFPTHPSTYIYLSTLTEVAHCGFFSRSPAPAPAIDPALLQAARDKYNNADIYAEDGDVGDDDAVEAKRAFGLSSLSGELTFGALVGFR